jgi:hypothetical protein
VDRTLLAHRNQFVDDFWTEVFRVMQVVDRNKDGAQDFDGHGFLRNRKALLNNMRALLHKIIKARRAFKQGGNSLASKIPPSVKALHAALSKFEHAVDIRMYPVTLEFNSFPVAFDHNPDYIALKDAMKSLPEEKQAAILDIFKKNDKDICAKARIIRRGNEALNESDARFAKLYDECRALRLQCEESGEESKHWKDRCLRVEDDNGFLYGKIADLEKEADNYVNELMDNVATIDQLQRERAECHCAQDD